MLKEVLLFGGGLAVGAIAGFLGAKFYYKEKMETEISEEIKEVTRVYSEKMKEKGATEGDKVGESSTEKKDEDENKGPKSDPEPQNHPEDTPGGKNQKVSYTSYSAMGVDTPSDMIVKPKKTINEEFEEDERENFLKGLEASERHERERRQKPKIIKYEDFGEDPAYDMVPLVYYVNEEVLVNDDDGTEIDDWDMSVGDCLDKYGFRHNNEQIIYVRNFFKGIDYSITKRFDDYIPLETG